MDNVLYTDCTTAKLAAALGDVAERRRGGEAEGTGLLQIAVVVAISDRPHEPCRSEKGVNIEKKTGRLRIMGHAAAAANSQHQSLSITVESVENRFHELVKMKMDLVLQ